jgi:hypothetical protein
MEEKTMILKKYFTTYTEITKYLIRFAVVVIVAVPILCYTQGTNSLKLIAYKVALATVAVGLAEVIWAFFFKPVFGKMEESSNVQSIMLFRGILYAAIILALCLGL